MSDDDQQDWVLPEDERRMVMIFEIGPADPRGERMAKVLDRVAHTFPEGDPDRPDAVQVAMSRRTYADLKDRIEEWTRDPIEPIDSTDMEERDGTGQAR